MKKLFLGLIATIMFCFAGNAQSKKEIAISKLCKVSMVSLVDNARLYYKDGMTNKQFTEAVSGGSTLSKEESLVLSEVFGFLTKKTDPRTIYQNYEGASLKALFSLPAPQTPIASRCGWRCIWEIIKEVFDIIIEAIGE